MCCNFSKLEFSKNKHELIVTVNSKNWLYSDFLGDKLRHVFVAWISWFKTLHFLMLGRGEYLYPFVAMQLFNDEASTTILYIIWQSIVFPRIFIILSKHNFSESEFF